MWASLKKFKNSLEMPFDPADEDTNRDAIVSGLLNVAILVCLVYIIPLSSARGLFTPQVIIVFSIVFIFILLRFFATKGQSRIISTILLLVFWGTIVYEFLWLENGLRAPAYSAALAFIITYTGLLHGRRAVWLLASITMLVNFTVYLGERNGYFLTEPQVPDIRFAIIGQGVFLLAIIYMLNKTLRNLRTSISLYRKESKNRLKAEQDVRKLNEELEIAYETTLEGWSHALELRDKETEGHSRRVTDLTVELGQAMGMDELELRNMYYGALLHDIGKMGIPDEILNKNGPLTPEERMVVKDHPMLAYELLKDINYLKDALAIPYSHHENWDGTGYPQGLKGEDIPLAARIFAVIDNWDALSSDRPYREAWPRQKVIDYLKENSGSKFDPRVVGVFLDQLAEKI